MRRTLPEAGGNIRSAVSELGSHYVRAPEFESNSCCGIVRTTSIPIRSALIGYSTQSCGMYGIITTARWYAAVGEPCEEGRKRSEQGLKVTSWLEVVVLCR
jgi:hypothetical protein